ncbi:MAG: hypothetical protein V3U93_11380 [Alphaproteobacteria bacterium]|jgi:hypothetical protein
MDMPHLIEIKNGEKARGTFSAEEITARLVDPAMRWMSTTFENLLNAVQNDFEWWADNQARMDSRFKEWLAGN